MPSKKINTPDKKNFLIVDGHAIVYRAWYAIQQPLTISKTGQDVRAVYGFLNSLISNINEFGITHCLVTFDHPKPTFRHKEFPEYKAHRAPMPDDLRPQFTIIKNLLNVLRIPVLDCPGYEADDIIGSIAHQAENKKIPTMILTGDTDTLQLVSPIVTVIISGNKKTHYTEQAVMDRYDGLTPNQIADLKALQGDKSDNIPGLPGVGLKTATRLLNEFQSIENLLENTSKISSERVKSLITSNAHLIPLSKRLTTIDRNAPVTFNLSKCYLWQYKQKEVVDELNNLEFSSFISRLPITNDTNQSLTKITQSNSSENNTTIINSEKLLLEMKEAITKSQSIAINCIGSSEQISNCNLLGIGISTDKNHSWFIPYSSKTITTASTTSSALEAIFNNSKIKVITHNANIQLSLLDKAKLNIENFYFDTMLASHIIGKNMLDLNSLTIAITGTEIELINPTKSGLIIAENDTPINQLAKLSGQITSSIMQISTQLENELIESKNIKNFLDVDMNLIPVLVQMQKNGITLDINLIKKMNEETSSNLNEVESSIYNQIGYEFNINSSKQLSDVLYEDLKLKPTKSIKTGFSTDASSLETMRQNLNDGIITDADPRSLLILTSVQEYRQLAKLKSTYLDTLPLLVNPNTKRIHTKYNQTGSSTGRISSIEPNIQNIPIVTSEKQINIRRAFTPSNTTNQIIAADYSQIELRILAHISEDKGLIKAFKTGEDIHSKTASIVFECDLKDVTTSMRRTAKIMNFGVIYGLTAFGISQQTGLAPNKSQEFIEKYFNEYPGIKEYIDETKKEAHERGYVETILGKRRYIPEIHSKNFRIRSSGERMAVNMPIQGTAADIIKIAMINIQKAIVSNNLESLMILQVHDELIFEVLPHETLNIVTIINQIMPSALKLKIPLEVTINQGSTWGDLKSVN